MSAPQLAPVRSLNERDAGTPTRFRLQAYCAAVRIDLEGLKEILVPGNIEKLSRDCVVYNRYDDERIFIFRFGAAVFLNFPTAEHDHYLSRIGITPVQAKRGLNEWLTEDHFTLNVEPGVTKVSFNAVTIPDLELSRLHLVAHVLAQSSALELIEREVESFLAESERMTALFKRGGINFWHRKRLNTFLGEGLSARHRIVTQLAVLKEPEKTWETEELYHLYKGLFDNFEISDRFEKSERMLQLSSQVSELLIDMVNSHRSEIMEFTIILLISIELFKSVFWG